MHYFTIGQRKGIGIPSNTDHRNYVVVGKEQSRNALLISFESPAAPGLYAARCRVSNHSYTSSPLPDDCRIEAKVRYRDPRVAIRWQRTGDDVAEIAFDEPQRALALGQVIALYDGTRLLGGAIYDRIG